MLVAEPDHEDEARIRLARIGFDHVLGALGDPLCAFADHPDAVEQSSRLTVVELADRLESVAGLQLVDVRGPGEVEDGTIGGATHMQLPELVSRAGELDPHRPTVVFCAGGFRSSIAASTLRAHGFADVSDLLGGYTAWRRELSVT